MKSHVIWLEGNGRHVGHDTWPAEKKHRIAELYQRFAKGERELGIHAPSVANIDKSSGRAFFTEEQAFDIYAANVAWCLHVEAQRLVPARMPNVVLRAKSLTAAPARAARMRDRFGSSKIVRVRVAASKRKRAHASEGRRSST